MSESGLDHVSAQLAPPVDATRRISRPGGYSVATLLAPCAGPSMSSPPSKFG